MSERKLKARIPSQPSQDGDGVKINRVAGPQLNQWLDPWLMLDEIRSDEAADYIGGFPPHPHRGFETITLMLAGRMRHRDHLGNEGVIEPGDVQWMTAGRGVIHSEMPEQDRGLLHGFQLWLNLPSAEKMKPAAYRDIRSADLPLHPASSGAQLRLIAGSLVLDKQSIEGPIGGLSTQPLLADVQIAPDGQTELSLDAGLRILLFPYEGSTTELSQGVMGIYDEGETLKITAGREGVRLLLVGGRPLKEPIAQYGPFVMNTQSQLMQAVQDYQNGTLTETP